MSLASRLVIVAAIELVFVVATRVVLHYLSWQSIEAELIRTALRMVTALAYWWLLKSVILSQKPNLSTLSRPAAEVGLLLFFTVPVLVGQFQPSTNVAVLFALTSIAVAVKEEFLFRGIVQNVLSQRLGAVKAILLTSAVFTVWHVGTLTPTVWVFSQIFLASVLLGLVYVGSGSILAVVVIHAVYDALFSFTPLIPAPLNANWGFIPLLAAVVCVIYWAFSGKGGLTLRSSGRAAGGTPLS